MKKSIIIVTLLFSTIFVIVSCSKLTPQAPNPETVMDAPLDGLTYAQNKLFNEGADEFDKVYISENGLGPIYVASSCGSCHSSDNRGHPFTTLTRFGQSDTFVNLFLNKGGPQLQQNAIPGHIPEQIPAGATFSKLIAPIASGVGFLELVSDNDILAMANANVNNPDGVRGHPNWNTIPDFITPNPNDIVRNGKYICRFGRKGSTYNLLQQTVTAFNQDMGITSSYLPKNPVNYAEGLNTTTTNDDPEISDNSINANVFYLQTLQAPIQRNADDANVISGKQIFINIGCETCHKQTLKTGFSPVEALSYKEFHPYTDLLLHDMGKDLDDGYTEGTATTSEWRTTPLWGLGLTSNAQGGEVYLLHDGRARSIENAILFHGGESEQSKIRYQNLSQSDKNNLLKFLKSL